jgi:AcrR family transcriptional regulator
VSTSTERGRDVRRRLLVAAAELIPEVGWGAVSTRVLATRAGVAPGLVHYHFPSLPALLSQAALGAVRAKLAALEQRLDGVATADDLVAALVPDPDEVDQRRLLLAELALAATRDEELRAALAESVAGFRDGLADRLRALGVAAPGPTAAVLVATADGLLLHGGLDGDRLPSGLDVVLRRLLADAEPAR